MTQENLDEFLGVKPVPPWRRHAKWIAAGIGVLLLLFVAVRWLGGPEAPEYATAKAERGNLQTTVSATGKLAPTNQVTVGSQLSGLVTQVLVDVNDRVTKGQPLAQIDPEQIEDQIRQNRAQLAANKAQVEQARATLSQARAQLSRLEEVHKLSNGRVPSQTELQTGRADAERAAAALSVAAANVLASQASLGQTMTQRARAVIRSPVSGVVLARQVDPGQTVAASFNTPTLFVIAEDLSQMKLEVAIDEADVGEVKEGQKATFTVDAFPGQTFPAAITRVDLGSNLSAQSASSAGTSASNQVVSYAADLSVDNPSLRLRPGMTATADIVTTDKKNVLLIPNAALRFRPQNADQASGGSGGIAGALTFRPRRQGTTDRSAGVERGAPQTIYVKGGDGEPKAVRIVTGNSDGMHTEMLSGDLKEGMEVITGQLSRGAAQGSGGGGG